MDVKLFSFARFTITLLFLIATLPGMWERTITVGSAGKTFSITGWKVTLLIQ